MALPACENPQGLFEYYSSDHDAPPDEVRRCIHDLFLYNISDGLDEKHFHEELSNAFCEHPFIKDLVDFIRPNAPIRFGAVNDWIHGHCSDAPLPYKWEVKKNTKILYEWLAFFFEGVSWRIPGRRSQVLYWN